MYLIIDDRLLITDRMLYPTIILITEIDYCDSCRVIGKPDYFLYINIYIVNIISINLFITLVVCHNERRGITSIYINFVYSHSFRSNQ